MANAVHPPIHTHPTMRSPSSLGFDFGLSKSSVMSAGWPSTFTPGHTQPAAFHQLASSMQLASQSRSLKRRHDPEADEPGARDDAMDRSPTPERVKKGPPKRARVTPVDGISKTDKDNSAPATSRDDENAVDVGVLLASLPPESLLPLLTSLVTAQPSLKSTILSLIPRPSLETALQALDASAKKLRDAYPYSNTPSISQPATSFGFGSGIGNRSTGGMRESYILSRLRPHITEFVSACTSYLPYFSYIPTTDLQQQHQSDAGLHSLSQSHATVIGSQRKAEPHPSETFHFLAALTNHVLSQPPLTQSSLKPLLFPRLSTEWQAWVDRIDEVVNRRGGMFGSEAVERWERSLDEFADRKGEWDFLREVRDMWVAKVGWLVGRTGNAMEEF